MSRIRSRDTGPELLVRSALHRAGYRFRLHRKDLPGRPDIVLPKYHTVVFVHGCFWHRHKGCKLAYTPKSRVAFWKKKFQSNVDRDRRKARALRQLGWHVITIWECHADRPTFWLRRLPGRSSVKGEARRGDTTYTEQAYVPSRTTNTRRFRPDNVLRRSVTPRCAEERIPANIRSIR